METYSLTTSLLMIASVFVLGIVFVKLSIANKHVFITPTYKKSHKRTETRLLNYILDDMRSNPSDWVATPYDMQSMRSPHFINDNKNIAVVVDQGSGNTGVVIKMNLETAHKYKEHDENTVATPISGDHVTKFLRNVEECIDTRGKELSFIESTLKNRL